MTTTTESKTEITNAAILRALDVEPGCVVRMTQHGWAEMPADYDAAKVTETDLREDHALRLIQQWQVERAELDAEDAIKVGDRVEAGEGEDHDTGIVASIDGDMAMVGWDSGVTTECPVADLSPTTERWSGGRRME